MGNVCRSLLYQLLDVLPSDLAALLPGARTSFSLAGMAKISGLAYFLMAVAATSAGWASDRCIASGKTPTLVRKTFMVVGQVGAGIFARCLRRRQRACALGSMPAVLGGVLGNQRFQYLGNYSNTCRTTSSWQVDWAAKLLR
jgi:hypothetical protein